MEHLVSRGIGIILLLELVAGCRPHDHITYFVPAGYEGWVHIVYTDGAAGQPVRRPRPGYETYVLPANGQLIVRDPTPPEGARISARFYAYTPTGRVRSLDVTPGLYIHQRGEGYLAVEPTRYGFSRFYVTRQPLLPAQQASYPFPADTLLPQDKFTPTPAHPFAPL
jgi:hypothetical protein